MVSALPELGGVGKTPQKCSQSSCRWAGLRQGQQDRVGRGKVISLPFSVSATSVSRQGVPRAGPPGWAGRQLSGSRQGRALLFQRGAIAPCQRQDG